LEVGKIALTVRPLSTFRRRRAQSKRRWT